jgi:two-component system phosphate regulon sensor histidine kinase PhoR
MAASGLSGMNRPTLLLTAGGAAAPLALAAAGQAPLWPALAASLAVAALGVVLARPPRPQPPAPPEHLAAPPVAEVPYAAILEELAEPTLVVEGGDDYATTGHRLIFANAAARELFRIYRPDARLVTVIRHPGIIELVDEALFGGVSGQAPFESTGNRERVWTAFARPLGHTAWNTPLALLVLRDQTDVRRAERMRADFLANASHELRTPLASLSGFIETLRGPAREDVGAREKFLGIMQVQAERMARLIDDLMSLSRIELNEHIAPQGRVDLSCAVTDVTDALAPIVKAKGVSFNWAAPARDAVTVEGDRDQIVQVLQNLVDNAVKYTPRGGVIGIELTSPVSGDPPPPRAPEAARMTLLDPDHRTGETYALVRVTDQGPGMPRDALPRLTERFYRVEGQKSGDKSGTGLGLAIVKHIVNRHRGGLATESLQGQGSTFSVWLPLAAPVVSHQTNPAAVAKVS